MADLATHAAVHATDAAEEMIVGRYARSGLVAHRNPTLSLTFANASQTESAVLREFDGASECRGALLVDGFPGENVTSVILANYLAEKFALGVIGDIALQPSTAARCVVEQGQPYGPIRILGNSKVVVFVCEVSLGGAASALVASAMIDFAARHQCRALACFEGVPRDMVKHELTKRAAAAAAAAAATAAPASAAANTADRDVEAGDPALRARMTPSLPALEPLPEDTLEAPAPPPAVALRNVLLFLTNSAALDQQMLALGHSGMESAIVGGLTGELLAAMPQCAVPVLVAFAPALPGVPDGHTAVSAVRTLLALWPDLHVDVTVLQSKAQELEASLAKLVEGRSRLRSSAGRLGVNGGTGQAGEQQLSYYT